MNQTIQTKLLTSLAKVFPHMTPTDNLVDAPSIFKNESFSFQVAYTIAPGVLWHGVKFSFSIESPLKEFITVRTVDLVPSDFPNYGDHDDDCITTVPGLYPDPLCPLAVQEVKPLANQWRSLWFEIQNTEGLPAGTYPITVKFFNSEGNLASCQSFNLKVIDANLPKQSLIHTEWFHTDCISNFYNTSVFSEKHWELLEKFIHTAANHGINMILTPLFTPPLDTEVGGERTTVQLIDVTLTNGEYTFGFDKLGRWIDMCQKVGIEYFEMSHLFTQWGATAIPKIMATVDGEYTRIFGWETSALDERYKVFLDLLLPELKAFIASKGIEKKCYFHISDEPSLSNLENYEKARKLVTDHLEGFPIIDALSDIDFYKTGAIEHPIPASNHIEPFLEAGVPDLWVYYCCGQYKDVSNRFMCMPSYRNRIIATQIFKYDIVGFLQWGYNFWNVQYSTYAIDPFKVTDAGTGFPSGDSFLVYPGNNEPIESLRLKVFAEALCDLRAMQMLAKLTSKEYVMELIEGSLVEPITFRVYPRSQDYILGLRYAINREIEKALNK